MRAEVAQDYALVGEEAGANVNTLSEAHDAVATLDRLLLQDVQPFGRYKRRCGRRRRTEAEATE